MQASAIIFAGGASRRMGQSKARQTVGGVPMLERVARAVGSICDETIVAGGLEGAEKWPQFEAKWVYDPPDLTGPVAGLIAGLRSARNDACLAVACDMPFLNPVLLEHLLEASVGHDAAVPKIDSHVQAVGCQYYIRILRRAFIKVRQPRGIISRGMPHTAPSGARKWLNELRLRAVRRTLRP